MSATKEETKKVFFTEKINKALVELKALNKHDRFQYRTDIKAVMCKGIEDSEALRIKRGLQIENGFFGLSRAFVPFNFFMLYRAGVFKE